MHIKLGYHLDLLVSVEISLHYECSAVFTNINVYRESVPPKSFELKNSFKPLSFKMKFYYKISMTKHHYFIHRISHGLFF